MTVAIIDADTICYMAAGACQKKNDQGEIELEPVSFAYSNAKNKIQQILKVTDCKDYKLYLTASNDTTSFRLKTYPEYKANRIGKDKPIYLPEVRQYLIDHWQAIVVSGIEADDAVCMEQYTLYDKRFLEGIFILDLLEDHPAVLCGIDKDLDQIPGWHYNYNKDYMYHVEPLEALKSQYLQLLTGDVADNIPRVKKGWRQKHYENEINNCNDEVSMYNSAIEWIKREKQVEEEEAKVYLHWVADLIYLRKHETDKYTPPIG